LVFNLGIWLSCLAGTRAKGPVYRHKLETSIVREHGTAATAAL